MKILYRRPLLSSFVFAALLSTAFGLLLYFNEELRQTTFAIIEQEEGEDGKIVKKVKVERPEPNEKQVREIARNRERQKREELKKKAREIREVLIEIEEVAEARKKDLKEQTVGGRLAELAFRLENLASRLEPSVMTTPQFSGIPYVGKGVAQIDGLARENADEIRALGAEALPKEGARVQLERTEELARQHAVLKGLVEPVFEDLRRDKQRRTANVIVLVEQIDETAAQYIKELRRLLEADANGDQPFEEALAAASGLAEEPDQGPVPSSAPSEEELEAMSTGELYESIQEMTAAVDEAFLENKAAEVAMTEGMGFEEAMQQVYAPQTNTGPELAEALDQAPPSNLEEYQAYNEVLDQATRAAEQMSRSAESRRNQVTGSAASQESQTAQQLQAALRERAELRGKMAMAASNAGRPKGNVQDLRALMAQAYGGASSSLGVPDGKTEFRASATLFEHGAVPENATLRFNSVMQNAIPSRRFDQSAKRKGWVFLDTWYVIGPWQRPVDSSFDQTYPPETLVDLDALYSGKRGPGNQPVELEWRFVQSENIRINPPDEAADAIYYGYTEVFSDRQMEVVVAVASDDLAKLWINDLVVWEDTGLSSWAVDEGFRSILLKPGYNEVLIRVESGPGVCYFSVLMCPVDALKEI